MPSISQQESCPHLHGNPDGHDFGACHQDQGLFCGGHTQDLVSIFQCDHLLLRDLGHTSATFAVP